MNARPTASALFEQRATHKDAAVLITMQFSLRSHVPLKVFPLEYTKQSRASRRAGGGRSSRGDCNAPRRFDPRRLKGFPPPLRGLFSCQYRDVTHPPRQSLPRLPQLREYPKVPQLFRRDLSTVRLRFRATFRVVTKKIRSPRYFPALRRCLITRSSLSQQATSRIHPRPVEIPYEPPFTIQFGLINSRKRTSHRRNEYLAGVGCKNYNGLSVEGGGSVIEYQSGVKIHQVFLDRRDRLLSIRSSPSRQN